MTCEVAPPKTASMRTRDGVRLEDVALVTGNGAKALRVADFGIAVGGVADQDRAAIAGSFYAGSSVAF